jgi:hypothetical protein
MASSNRYAGRRALIKIKENRRAADVSPMGEMRVNRHEMTEPMS